MLSQGEVVELEISLWPGGIVFDAGESLSLEIKGRNPVVQEFEGLDAMSVTYNVGRHRVHTGGERPSQVMVSLKRGA
jgi:predicted acyl esterase